MVQCACFFLEPRPHSLAYLLTCSIGLLEMKLIAALDKYFHPDAAANGIQETFAMTSRARLLFCFFPCNESVRNFALNRSDVKCRSFLILLNLIVRDVKEFVHRWLDTAIVAPVLTER
jgi:hypothetical protein